MQSLQTVKATIFVRQDTRRGHPVASRVFPGYMLDKKDFLDFMGDVGPIKGKVILVDMGFFSAENLDYSSPAEIERKIADAIERGLRLCRDF